MIAAVLAMLCMSGTASVMNSSAVNCPYDCDVNQDGYVDILDAIMINRYLGGLFYVSDPSVMDVDGNHIINVGDSQCVVAHTVNLSYTCVFS